MSASGVDVTGAGMQQVTLRNLLSSSNFINDGLLQPVQWHIWTDGVAVVSALLIKGKWLKGPDLSYSDTNSGTRIAKVAEDLLRGGYEGQKWPSMSVVFHCADDFNCVPVKTDMAAPDKYDLAESQILDEPESIIDERPQGAAAYRYIPLPGQRSATSVRLQAERGAVFQALIAPSSKARCVVTSAPVEFISAIPAFLEHRSKSEGDSNLSGADVIVLAYQRFTVVAGFRSAQPGRDELGAGAGLFTIVNIPSSRGVAERVKLEIERSSLGNVAVFLVQASPGVNTDGLAEDLTKHLQNIPGIMIGHLSMENVIAEITSVSPDIDMPEDQTIFRPEFLSAYRKVSDLPGGPMWQGSDQNAEVFSRAAMQNYSLMALRVEENRISYPEAMVAVVLRTARFVAMLAFVAWFVVTGIDISRSLKSEAWNLPPEQADAAAAELAKFTQLDKALSHWKSLTRPRSDAWTVMETICDILPQQKGLVARTLDYRVEMIAPSMKSADQKPTSVGYRRLWVIQGAATEQGAAFLDTLSTGKINEIVRDLQARFNIQQTVKLPLNSNIERQSKPPITINGVSYPIEFTLAITQLITDAEKEVALPTGAVPIPPVGMTTQP